MTIKSESGVSEIIGSILLVSLVVGLMMVVTTVVISQPRPDKIPEISASISMTNVSGPSGPSGSPDYLYNVTITNTGGDALQDGEYLVVINGNPAMNYHNSTGATKEDEWSFDKPIIVNNGNIKPNTVQIYYNGPSSKVLLAQTNFE